MDSKIVNKAIKKDIWPILKEQGFGKFTSRSAWRFNQDTIEVINFQSFNAFLAKVLGCTTYSFAVNLGVYFINIPERFPSNPVKVKDGVLLPNESSCHLGYTLLKGLSQPELERKSVWYINDLGSNLEEVINDVKQMLITDGIKWLEKYSHMDAVLDTLLNEEENLEGTHGFGRKNSPIRNYTGAYIAYFLQRYDLSRNLLEKAINSGSFSAIEERLRQDYDLIKEK